MRLIARFFMFLPLLEIVGFIIAGSLFGALPTLFAFLATTFLGIYLLRNYQWLAIVQMREQLKAGYVSVDDMRQSGFIILAGILLIIPGFITDIIGLLCLLPTIRSGLLKKLLAAGWLKESHPSDRQEGPRIIEGESWHVEDKD